MVHEQMEIGVFSAQVQALYRQITGHDIDAAELARLEKTSKRTPGSLAVIRRKLAKSPGAAAAINDLYQQVFGRDADEGGMVTYRETLAQPGGTLDGVRSILANSGEAADRIKKVYHDIFELKANQADPEHINPEIVDPETVKAHQRDLAQGAITIDAIRAELARSEKAASTINDLSMKVLEFSVNGETVARCQDILVRRDESLQDVQAELARTTDAWERIKNIYKKNVDRTPSLQEALPHLEALAGWGATLQTIREKIAQSPEARNKIASLYKKIYGREADKGDEDDVDGYQKGLEKKDVSLADIQASLASKPEARSSVNQLYRKVLGRPVDKTGLINCIEALKQGGSLDGIQVGLAMSDDEARKIIIGFYRKLLGRGPYPGELTEEGAITGHQKALAMPGAVLADIESSIAMSDEARDYSSRLMQNPHGAAVTPSFAPASHEVVGSGNGATKPGPNLPNGLHSDPLLRHLERPHI